MALQTAVLQPPKGYLAYTKRKSLPLHQKEYSDDKHAEISLEIAVAIYYHTREGRAPRIANILALSR